jgi:hypothetical protein
MMKQLVRAFELVLSDSLLLNKSYLKVRMLTDYEMQM